MYFFYIFWWWLRHCYAYRLPIKDDIVLNILSVLLKCLRIKCLLWSYKNQWYFLFYYGVQWPFLTFFDYLSVSSFLVFSFLLFLLSSFFLFLCKLYIWLFLRNNDWKLYVACIFCSCVKNIPCGPYVEVWTWFDCWVIYWFGWIVVE